MTENPIELQQFIVDTVRSKTSAEAIGSVVEKQIDGIVHSAVINAFRSFGNIREQIEKQVTAALAVPSDLGIPAYGHMVLSMLRQQIDRNLSALVDQTLADEINDILGIAPPELKLTDIVADMRKRAREWSEDRYRSGVTCFVEESLSSAGYYTIYLDEETRTRANKYDCKVRLAISSSGEIYSLTIDRRDAGKSIVMGSYYGWEKQLFAAYCCKTKFIVDDPEPDCSLEDA